MLSRFLPGPAGKSKWLAALLLAGVATVLAGCGFQLRGSLNLPFETLYVPISSTVGVELKRNIAAGTGTRLVETPEGAQAQVQFSQDQREKVILSLNTAGRVREFQLRHRVSFRVIDRGGREFLPLNEITLTRDIPFNDAQVLAREAEEALLYRDMQTDMVQQIMRRLSVARMPESAEAAPESVTRSRDQPAASTPRP